MSRILMQKASYLILLLLLLNHSRALIPLANTPSWTSIDNDYATGAGLADINNDCFIDFCTANGNDMAINKQAIYFNHNGSLETNASWRSADSGYFGHLYLGDINNDGWIDLAVSYLGFGISNQGRIRIYRNDSSGMATTPFWQSANQFNSFDVCFGDIDLDGDLDLAVAAGDAYNNIRVPAQVYKNNDGVLEPIAFWSARDSTPSDAIRFADLNRDGYLDLIVGGYRKLSVYYNQNGVYPQTANQVIAERGWILRMAPADFNNDGWIDLAIATNGQLSGDSSRIKVFKNNYGQLDSVASFVMLKNRRYCSCVAWADANNDGYLDLAAGGWWESLVVFENRNGVMDTQPSWSYYNSSLVSEAIVWGDVRNYHIEPRADTFIGDGIRKLYYLKKMPIQSIGSVKVANQIIGLSNYCYDLVAGWIVIDTTLNNNDTIIVSYQYSKYPDLAVTNWTQTAGNYLFYNTTTPAITSNQAVNAKNKLLTITPNPFSGRIKFQFNTKNNFNKIKIKIYDSTGKLINSFSPDITDDYFIWDGKNHFGHDVSTGVYLCEISDNNQTIIAKIIKI